MKLTFADSPNCFRHDAFQRGHAELLPRIVRKNKNRRDESSSDDDVEPTLSPRSQKELGEIPKDVSGTKRQTSSDSKQIEKFVQGLRAMILAKHEQVGLAEDETTIEIRDLSAFEEKVLAVYFDINDLKGFQRQLESRGFEQIGELKYHHPNFRVDKESELEKIQVISKHDRSIKRCERSKKSDGSEDCDSSSGSDQNSSSSQAEQAGGARESRNAFQLPSQRADELFRPIPSHSRSVTNFKSSSFHPSSTSVQPTQHEPSRQVPVHTQPETKETGIGNGAESMGAEEDDNEEGEARQENGIPKSPAFAASKNTPFVHATYEIAMLESPAIGFNDAGTALEIRDEGVLAKEILPRYFKHANVSSFIRQLNMYGFEKTVGSHNACHTFYNDNFRKDRPDLLSYIQRRPNKLRMQRKKELEGVSSANPMDSSPQTRSRPMPFVHATYELAMLNNEAIGFSSNGKALEIRSEQLLSSHLPKHFKHKNLSSFIRQLNMYGFEKIDSVPGVMHTFQHQHFQQGKVELLPLISRKHVKIDRTTSQTTGSTVDESELEPLSAPNTGDPQQPLQLVNSQQQTFVQQQLTRSLLQESQMSYGGVTSMPFTQMQQPSQYGSPQLGFHTPHFQPQPASRLLSGANNNSPQFYPFVGLNNQSFPQASPYVPSYPSMPQQQLGLALGMQMPFGVPSAGGSPRNSTSQQEHSRGESDSNKGIHGNSSNS